MNIGPEDLRPVDLNGTPFPLRRIDCVYALKLTSEEESAVDSAFCQLQPEDRSLNQSLELHLCKQPIAINIEAKRQHGHDPLVQLGVWSAAGLARRQKDRCNAGGVGALMPGITVVGHIWELWFASTKVDGNVVRCRTLNLSIAVEVADRRTYCFLGIARTLCNRGHAAISGHLSVDPLPRNSGSLGCRGS
jgi:hypothetical protein